MANEVTKTGDKALAPARDQQRKIGEVLQSKDVQDRLRGVATKFLTPEKALRLGLHAISKTPKLAECPVAQILGALMTTVALGLEPNTPLGHAYLIPYKRSYKDGNSWKETYDCQFQIGYKGFIALAYRSPYMASMSAEAIHGGDTFEHAMGSEAFLKYVKALQGRGELIGSFCWMRLKGHDGQSGEEIATVLDLPEISKSRDRSETYKALVRRLSQAEGEKDRTRAQKNLNETPWVMFEDDMAIKTAIKKHCKRFPIDPSMVAASVVDDVGMDGKIDLGKLAESPELVKAIADGETDPPERTTDEQRQITSQQPAQEEKKPAAAAPKANGNKPPAEPKQQAAKQPEPDHDPDTGEIRDDGPNDSDELFGAA